MGERRSPRFRIAPDAKRGRKFQMESDATGRFQAAIAGLDASDVDRMAAVLRKHGREVQDCREVACESI